jgi:hypothetical protein
MSFTISLTNQIAGYSADQVYWAIIAMNQNGVFCWMDAQGNLIPMTMADNKYPVGTATNCNKGTEFANYFKTLAELPQFTIPSDGYINSGQIWISLGTWLPFCVNTVNGNGQATGFAPPSVTNPGLQGYNTFFQMAELAYNIDGTMHLNTDTTAVDDMGFPITMALTDANGTQTVGFTADSAALFNAFSTCQDTNFQSLVISGTTDSGATIPNLRILSPEHAAKDSNGNPPAPGIGLPSSVVDYFSDFYTAYIDQCWNYYTNTSVTIYISGQAYTGQVQNGTFNFYAGTQIGGTAVLNLNKPQNWEVLQCAGEFKVGNDVQMNIEKFVVAAMYRTVFMEMPAGTSDSWCDAAMEKKYYTNQPINYYGRILHDNSINGLCYAFAFDDVCDRSSSVVSTTTTSLALTLPAWS